MATIGMDTLKPRAPSQEPMMGSEQSHEPPMASAQLSHSMDPKDLENPMNWQLHRRLYTSLVAWLCAVAVAFGLTCYTAAIPQVAASFNFNPNNDPAYLPIAPISGYSVYLFGIFFAPIITPHIAERVGRSLIYLIAIPLCGLFLLGAGFSKTFAGVAVLRFLAGLTGGPCLVLIEGTFADIWSAETTNTYYAFLGLAQFVGTALGGLVGGYLVESTDDWRWTQWFSAGLCATIWLVSLGISESYQREIPRRRAKRHGVPLNQEPALSGMTFSEMFRITVIDPIRQVFTDPVVSLCTFLLIFVFAVVLQFFITVPVALGSAPPAGPGFTPHQVGLAFTGAIGGAVVAAIIVIVTEQITTRICTTTGEPTSAQIERRLIPAMLGTLLVTGALFWIGATVGNPSFEPIIPITGTAVFVCGVALVVFTVIPYLFDAYPPAGTLAALTAAASGRILFAGALPLVILQFFTGVTPKWALFTFGFISIPLIAVPGVLFWFGTSLRARSRYSRVTTMDMGEETRLESEA